MFKYIAELSNKTDYKEVLIYLYNIEKKYKENASYWNLRGDIEYCLGNKEESFRCYNNSISIEKTKEVVKKLNDNYNQNIVEDKESFLSLKDFIIFDMNVSETNILRLNKFISDKNIVYYSKGIFYSEKNNNLIKMLLTSNAEISKNATIFIKYDKEYIWNVRDLVRLGYLNINIIVSGVTESLDILNISKKYLDYISNYDRSEVLTFHYYNASDSNVYAMYSNIPEKYKDKYKINIIKGEFYRNLSNIILTPLISEIYISGHGTFFIFPYPNLMFNLELNHGAISIKTCGAMGNNIWYASPNHYKSLDKLCVSSELDMLILCSFGLMDREKFAITGTPRTDLLLISNGHENLEKLFKMDFKNKKIILNMPTFHYHEKKCRCEGDKELNDFIKIKNFDYQKLDKFLEENNYILITKAHYLDESVMTNKNKIKKFNNIYAFSDSDLESANLDLYEVVNSADLLITDYSSIYSDFVFMNKPSLFIITDIDEYRSNRGIILEPYDYWMVGYKIVEEKDLCEKIKLSLEKDEFKSKREELKSVFFKYNDDKNSKRIWDLIDDISNNLKKRS